MMNRKMKNKLILGLQEIYRKLDEIEKILKKDYK